MTEIFRLLREKLLVLVEEPQHLQLKVDRCNKLLNEVLRVCSSTEQAAAVFGIGELYQHFQLLRFDPDVASAFSILKYVDARKVIDKAIILGYKPSDIPGFLSYDTGLLITQRTAEIYCKYFCNPGMPKTEWIKFLSKHDVFGIFPNVTDGDLSRVSDNRLKQTDSSKFEFSYIAKKAFDQVISVMESEAPDPDTCTKWFKIHAAARLRTPSDPLADAKAAEEVFEMGYSPAPDFKLMSLDDVVSYKEEKTEEKKP